MSEDNPSQHEANKVVRVLSGKQLKFTVRVHKADGSIIELQSDNPLKLDYDSESRSLWLQQVNSGYTSSPVCPFEPGMIILTEENPKL